MLYFTESKFECSKQERGGEEEGAFKPASPSALNDPMVGCTRRDEEGNIKYNLEKKIYKSPYVDVQIIRISTFIMRLVQSYWMSSQSPNYIINFDLLYPNQNET